MAAYVVILSRKLMPGQQINTQQCGTSETAQLAQELRNASHR
jgi:hypothetical protein